MVARKRGRIVLTGNMNRFRDGRDRNEVKPREGDVGIVVCGDENWVDGVVVVIAGCPSEADAAENAVCNVLKRNEIEKLNEGKLLKYIVWEDGRLFCKAKKRK